MANKVKAKTKKAISKRIIKTKSGKLKRKQAFRSHMAHNKTTKQKRQSKKDVLISPVDQKRYDQLI